MIRRLSRFKTFFKFAIVGVSGTLIDFIIYKSLIIFLGLSPATARFFSYECGTINNFIWNNKWTFRDRQTNNSLLKRFFSFQLIGSGGLIISVVLTKILDVHFGNGSITIYSVTFAYNTLYFLVTVPLVLIWNFTLNHFITWRVQHNEE